MRIFLDTANLDDIREIARWGIISGVTTNPTLLAREGKNVRDVIVEICEIVNGPVSMEVVSTDAEGMVREAREYVTWHPNVIIKIPMIPEGLAATAILAREGIQVNMTLIFNPNQALFAALAGAAYVSPFLGRLDDISTEGMDLIREIVAVFRQDAHLDTQILAASLRHPRHLVEAAKAGADVATCPPAVSRRALEHPLTDIGLERFLNDWRQLEATLTREVARVS